MPLPILIASDHAGFALKERLEQALQRLGLPFEDYGPDSEASVDYPDFAHRVARAVASGQAERGVLICGSGQGMVKKRAVAGGAGAFAPPTFHQDRIRHMPDGQLYATVANGKNNMPAYPQIQVNDRWAIVAYIRALQLSQNATLDDVPPEQRQQLQSQGGAERLIAASRARHGSR